MMDSQTCRFCLKVVSSSVITLHESYCEINTLTCERCGRHYDQS